MLTQVEDAIPGPVPAPAFQLLVLCVLKSSVMKHHTDDALKFRGIQFLQRIQGRCYCFRSKHINPGLSLQTLTYANTQCMSESYLHHFTSDFRKFPNFPIVKHSNFIGLACNDKIVIRCSSVESSSCIKLLTRIILSQVLWKETALSSFLKCNLLAL